MATLRQRSTKESQDGTMEHSESSSAYVPPSLHPLMHQAAPVIVSIWRSIEAVIPFFVVAKAKTLDLYKLVEPYHPDDLLPAGAGFAMAFFGGEFPLLIATFVAFQETGSWKGMRNALLALWREGGQVLKASEEDNKKDEDGDGTPDAQQRESSEYLTRKILLAIKVVDPASLGAAITAVSAGSLAVLATLKLKFARALSLGASLGKTLEKPAHRYFTPILKREMDPDYHKWVTPTIQYGSKIVAMTAAFWLQRVIAAVHSAVNGGQLFTSSTARYLNKHKIITFNADQSNLDEMAGYAVAVVGLYYQFFYGTPLLLSLLLLPFTLCEWGIRVALNFV